MTETSVEDVDQTEPAETRQAEHEEPRPPVDPAVLRAEIEVTRAQLADTVAALAAKTDVKSRVRGSVSDAAGQLKGRVHDAAGQLKDRVHDVAEHAEDVIGDVGGRMSAATHSLHLDGHRGGHRRDSGAGTATAARSRRTGRTVVVGAAGGALLAFVGYLVWRGLR